MITSTILVWRRSRDLELDLRRSELARPAPEQLSNWAMESTLVDAGEHNLPPYGEGMLRYSASVVELLEHAVEVGLDKDVDTSDLATARDDASALNHLLSAMADEPTRLDKVGEGPHHLLAVGDEPGPHRACRRQSSTPTSTSAGGRGTSQCSTSPRRTAPSQ